MRRASSLESLSAAMPAAIATFMRINAASMATSRSWSKGDSRSDKNRLWECRSYRRRQFGMVATGNERTTMPCSLLSQVLSAPIRSSPGLSSV
jgi:hypothetical protein